MSLNSIPARAMASSPNTYVTPDGPPYCVAACGGMRGIELILLSVQVCHSCYCSRIIAESSRPRKHPLKADQSQGARGLASATLTHTAWRSFFPAGSPPIPRQARSRWWLRPPWPLLHTTLVTHGCRESRPPTRTTIYQSKGWHCCVSSSNQQQHAPSAVASAFVELRTAPH
jgi:hypothetical protein